jgi:hypothetical protein
MAGGDQDAFVVAVAVQNDTTCHAAIRFAVDLCRKTVQPFKLIFVFVVAQNPKSKIPYLDHLERSCNVEIHEEAKRNMRQLLTHLDRVTNGVGPDFMN